jgi:hypothetical protein
MRTILVYENAKLKISCDTDMEIIILIVGREAHVQCCRTTCQILTKVYDLTIITPLCHIHTSGSDPRYSTVESGMNYWVGHNVDRYHVIQMAVKCKWQEEA